MASYEAFDVLMESSIRLRQHNLRINIYSSYKIPTTTLIEDCQNYQWVFQKVSGLYTKDILFGA